jgi:hypothetical protein
MDRAHHHDLSDRLGAAIIGEIHARKNTVDRLGDDACITVSRRHRSLAMVFVSARMINRR